MRTMRLAQSPFLGGFQDKTLRNLVLNKLLTLN